MYLDFFGLRELPFNNTPDPRFFYATPDHEEALASLIYAVQARKGFVLLTGEVGAGKTLVSRLMLRHFGARIAFANVNHAVQNAQDLMEAICTELEIRIPKGATNARLVRELHDALLAKFAQNIPVVLVLDEAQNLPNDAFEQLRMIGNLEADDAKLLQTCIVGQPELQVRFAAPELRQLRQRLYRSFHLPALTQEHTEGYIRHRLNVSGGRMEDIFVSDAVEEVFKLSRGLPRLINTICDNAMLSAYAADTKPISAEFVRNVATQMMLLDPEHQPDAGMPGRDANDDSTQSPPTMREASSTVQTPTPVTGSSVKPGFRRTAPSSTPSSASFAVSSSVRGDRAGRSAVARPAEAVVHVVRGELARMRKELSGLIGQTVRRVDALEQRLQAQTARTVKRPSPSPGQPLSPVLLRAAALIERTERARRRKQREAVATSTTKTIPDVAPEDEPEDGTGENTCAASTIPSPAEVDAVIRRLEADAQTAASLLRAWRRRREPPARPGVSDSAEASAILPRG